MGAGVSTKKDETHQLFQFAPQHPAANTSSPLSSSAHTPPLPVATPSHAPPPPSSSPQLLPAVAPTSSMPKLSAGSPPPSPGKRSGQQLALPSPPPPNQQQHDEAAQYHAMHPGGGSAHAATSPCMAGVPSSGGGPQAMTFHGPPLTDPAAFHGPLDLSKDPFLAPHVVPGHPPSQPPTSVAVIHQQHPPPMPPSHVVDPRDMAFTDLGRRVFVLESRLANHDGAMRRLEGKLSEVEHHVRDPPDGTGLSPQVEQLLTSKVTALENSHQEQIRELRRSLDDAITLGKEHEKFQVWQRNSLRDWDQELSEAERRIHDSASAMKLELNRIGPAVTDLEFRTAGLKDIVSTCGAGVAQLDKLMMEGRRRCAELQKDVGSSEKSIACLGSNVEGQRLRLETLEARAGALAVLTQVDTGEAVPLWQALRKLEDRVAEEARLREEGLKSVHDHATSGLSGHSDRHKQHHEAVQTVTQRCDEGLRKIEEKLTQEVKQREKSLRDLHDDMSKHRHHSHQREDSMRQDTQQIGQRLDELFKMMNEFNQEVAKQKHHVKHNEAGRKESDESLRSVQQHLQHRVDEFSRRVEALEARQHPEAGQSGTERAVMQALVKLEQLMLQEAEQRELGLHELREQVQSEHEKQRKRLEALHADVTLTPVDSPLRAPPSEAKAGGGLRSLFAQSSRMSATASPRDLASRLDDIDSPPEKSCRSGRRFDVEGALGKLRGQLKVIQRELSADRRSTSMVLAPNGADVYSDQHSEHDDVMSFAVRETPPNAQASPRFGAASVPSPSKRLSTPTPLRSSSPAPRPPGGGAAGSALQHGSPRHSRWWPEPRPMP